MIKKKYSNESRLRRHRRVRKKVSGTSLRPRLSVFRSGNQIYAQIIDDERQTTLVAASSRDAELEELAKAEGVQLSKGSAKAEAKPASKATAKAKAESKGAAKASGGESAPTEASAEDGAVPPAIVDNRRMVQARLVGKLVARRAQTQGIQKVVFDRGGYLYHGRVAALATGAREGGLDF